MRQTNTRLLHLDLTESLRLLWFVPVHCPDRRWQNGSRIFAEWLTVRTCIIFLIINIIRDTNMSIMGTWFCLTSRCSKTTQSTFMQWAETYGSIMNNAETKWIRWTTAIKCNCAVITRPSRIAKTEFFLCINIRNTLSMTAIFWTSYPCKHQTQNKRFQPRFCCKPRPDAVKTDFYCF
jgi:hypothetical protein